jgi:membrane protease YdiL (CAAX protease family)
VLENYRGFGPGQIVGFVIGLTCGAIMLTWLYNGSGGSILLVTLWHGGYNLASASQGASGILAAALSILVMIPACVLVIFESRKRRREAGRPSIERASG